MFDTNVFVSGFTRPEGRSSQALAAIATGHGNLFISQPIIDELTRVLDEKFNWAPDNLQTVLAWIDRNAHLTFPTEALRSAWQQ